MKKILLYGYHDWARNIYKKLSDIHELDIFFVDKNISDGARNIFALHELVDMPNKEKAIVYICMRNAMQHEIAAEELYAMGFRQIVFLPVSARYNEQAYKMVRLWNEIYQNGYKAFSDIPSYETLLAEHKCIAGNVINIPMELVFTFKNDTVMWKYNAVHISLLESYNALYRFIYECGEMPYEYLQECYDLLGKKKHATIRDRINLYETLSERLQNDSAYYATISCPVKVENGKFYLQDAHHRANLAYHLGKDFLPVVVEDGVIDYDYLDDFYQNRNYKLFRALSDIVLAAPVGSKFHIISDKYKELIEKYMLLLLKDESLFKVEADGEDQDTGAIKGIFIQDECGYIGEICIVTSGNINKAILRNSYLIDNCIYKVKVMEF